MHIVDGALSTEVLVAGAALTVLGVGYGLKAMDYDRLPQVGVLSATFFIASLIHVPVGPSSVHLIMNGLIGLALGWAAFPALLVALLLQAVFFGFGGLTILGANTFNIALPAVMVHYMFKPMILRSTPKVAALWGGAAGAMAIVLTTVLVALSLAITGDAFIPAAQFTLLAHIPVMIVEGFLTGAAVMLICQVKPELLGLDEAYEGVPRHGV